MEQSKSTHTNHDGEKKSRSRVFTQIAIWLAVLLLTAVGVTFWDRYNYPIPYAIPIDPFWTDTTELPPYLNRPREAVGRFQSKVREIRRDRIFRHLLSQLELSNSKWTVYSSSERGLFDDTAVHFDSNGTVLFKFGVKPEPEHSFFDYKSYERSSNGELIFSSDTTSETYRIWLVEDRRDLMILLTESDDRIRLTRQITP